MDRTPEQGDSSGFECTQFRPVAGLRWPPIPASKLILTREFSIAGPIEACISFSNALMLVVVASESKNTVRDITLRAKDGWSPDQIRNLVKVICNADTESRKEIDLSPPFAKRFSDMQALWIEASGVIESLPSGSGYSVHARRCIVYHSKGHALDPINLPVYADVQQAIAEDGGILSCLETPFTEPATQRKVGKDDGYEVKTARSRAKRGNSCRAQVFVQFLIDTYGREYLETGAGVLDVAGGSGEVCFELRVMQGIPCTTIDPRSPKFTKSQLRKIERVTIWRDLLNDCSCTSPMCLNLLRHWNHSAFEYIPAMLLNHDDVEGDKHASVEKFLKFCDEENNSSYQMKEAVSIIQNCSIVAGMHSDQATASIIDTAILLHKPWAVVPCCVFAKTYPLRRTCGHYSKRNPCKCFEPECFQVRSYDQLLLHLLQRTDRETYKAMLKFDGQNTVLFELPFVSDLCSNMANRLVNQITNEIIGGLLLL